jgi:hypothetical protein
MRVFLEVIGIVLIATSANNFWLQLTRRRVSVRQVARARAGFPARTALLTAALGLWDLTRWPAAACVMFAIIAWELVVQATAVVRTRVFRQS